MRANSQTAVAYCHKFLQNEINRMNNKTNSIRPDIPSERNKVNIPQCMQYALLQASIHIIFYDKNHK